MLAELLFIGLLAPPGVTVHVFRPPDVKIDGAMVTMDDGDQEPVTRRTRGGSVTFPRRCSPNLKFIARIPHPAPAYLSNPSAPRYCLREPVELWIRPRPR
jgi:hypothetical protein